MCLVTAAVFVIPAGVPAATVPGGSEYTLTIIPYYSPEKIWTKFAPFIEHLKQTTDQPWELKLYPNHEAVLAALCAGEVSFAFLGPVPLGRVIDRCDAEVVAVAQGKDGKPYYRSVLLTADPSVRSLADLRGKRFGLFKGSTAAHIFPLKMLKDGKIDETGIVPVFYESQDRIMNALLDRAVAGAGVKDALYRKFKAEPVRVLKTSEPLPGFAFASARNVNAATRRLFLSALLRLDPRRSAADRKRMLEWDDEIKYGFIEPPAEYRASVLNVLSVYNEIIHEDR